MTTPVGVIHQAPAFREGVAHRLDRRRFRYEDPSERGGWSSWLKQPGPRAALVNVDTKASWVLLAGAVAASHVTAIAIIPEADVALCLRAFRLGVDGIAYASDPPDRIVRVLKAALASDALLPNEIVRHIAHEARLDIELSDSDTRLLQAVVKGAKVRAIAEAEHVSLSTARRRLRDICQKLHAANVQSAIVTARSMGLIE